MKAAPKKRGMTVAELTAAGFKEQPDGSWAKVQIARARPVPLRGTDAVPPFGSPSCQSRIRMETITVPAADVAPEPKLRKARQMNKTEAAFARLLESRVLRGEFLRFVYEGLTVRWCGMRYTPDFTAFTPAGGIVLFEVKGPQIWDRDKVRFRGCRDQWPEFAFEMHQKLKGDWRRIE